MDVQGIPVTGFGSVADSTDLSPGFRELFASRRYDLGRIRLHAVIGGSGPPVLLIGGWPQFWWQWRKIMPRLAEHHRVIAVDPRGVGLSDIPDTGYDAGSVAADIADLMTLLGHERFSAVGHDVGMGIAYALAADHPSRLDQLVLAEATLPGISVDPSIVPRQAGRIVPAMFHLMFNRLATLNEQLVAGREDVYFGDQFAHKGATPTAIPAHAVDVYVEALRRPGRLRASFEFYRAFDETIAQNEERARTALTMPILAVGGAVSRGAGVAADVRTVATDVTESVIPACGHYLPEEQPETLGSLLLDFFGQRHSR